MSTNSPIKVLFLGSPNSGKTTLINGFIGKDVLPESMCRSTRIRTYIGGADNNSDCVFLFDVDSTIPKRIDAKNFIDYSSYELDDKHLVNKNIESKMTAVIPTRHILSDYDICLIDTVGFGVNCFDDKETIKAIDDADVVVIIYDASSIGGFTNDELLFLKEHMFSNDGSFPIERIIVVPNKIDKVASVREVSEIAKTDLCNIVKYGTPEWQILSDNICPISAYYYRLARVGISNHLNVKSPEARLELMNHDAQMLIRASISTGDYKRYLYEKSHVGKLIELLEDLSYICRNK